ncbi:MAG: C40 family peptidase [Thermodesulfobacteriota bacterium]
MTEKGRPGSYAHFLFILLLFLPSVVTAGKNTLNRYSRETYSQNPTAFNQYDDIVETRLREEAEKFLGTPYRAGGTSAKGIDCSGLTSQLYSRLFGINIPHNSTRQSRLPILESVPMKDLRPGDLVFYGPGKKRINHVGIYLADGKFIHASRKAGVTISSLSNRYWRNRFIGSKRVKGLASYVNTEMFASRERGSKYETNRVFELGYNTPLIGTVMDLNLGAFTEFNQDDPTGGLSYAGFDPLYNSYDLGFRKGAWVSTDARIFQWLAISPSVGYVEGRSTVYEKDGTRQILGLGARMAPQNASWALMMSASYATLPDESLEWSKLSHSSWKTLDMSFGFSYNFNEYLKMSVSGTRLGSDLSHRRERVKKDLMLDDVSFQFDLGF